MTLFAKPPNTCNYIGRQCIYSAHVIHFYILSNPRCILDSSFFFYCVHFLFSVYFFLFFYQNRVYLTLFWGLAPISVLWLDVIINPCNLDECHLLGLRWYTQNWNCYITMSLCVNGKKGSQNIHKKKKKSEKIAQHQTIDSYCGIFTKSIDIECGSKIMKRKWKLSK